MHVLCNLLNINKVIKHRRNLQTSFVHTRDPNLIRLSSKLSLILFEAVQRFPPAQSSHTAPSHAPSSFMQNWPTESSESSPSTNPRDTLSLLQDGFCREQSGRSVHLGRTEDHRGISQHPQSDGRDSPTQGVHADDLDQQLLRLSLDGGFSGDRCDVPGQRIIEYENSLAPSIPTQALGFKVMKRAGSDPQAVHLADLPNGMDLSPVPRA